MRNKIVDAAEAVAIIRSGDTVASSGFVGVGTPDEIIKILNEAANRALQIESVRKVMADNAYFPTGGPSDALWSAFAKQISQFEKLFSTGLIKVE